MQPSEFLDTAARLARGHSEGDWRSSISRAYYAAFHFFREFLYSGGVDVGQGGRAHFDLCTGLANSGYPRIQRIGNRLDDLRDKRVVADYNLHHLVVRQNAQDAVQECRNLLTDFQAAIAAIPPADVVDGVQRYLQNIGHLPRTP